MKYEPITEFSAERCEILAQVIEQQPHTTPDAADGFNMARLRHICGTPCCIAGFAAEMLTRTDGNPITDFIGCSAGEGIRLFYGNFPSAANPLSKPEEYMLYITPIEAAAALRSLIVGRMVRKENAVNVF
jgi:hypothetical protein